jgi:1,4-dihydroxy-2-naphthoate octaprenyltransferase
MTPRFRLGFWRLADPKISLASMGSIFLGAAAAARDGRLAWGWLALTVLGIFAIEVAKNASGELFDWDSGTDQAVAAEDRSPFSGGKRVLVDGLLTRGQTRAIAAAGYAGGSLAGLVIVLLREPDVLWFGIVGLALAYFYHARPVQLSYRGLGELAVTVVYGPLIAGGTYLVQRGTVAPYVLALSVPLGLLIGAFLWINEFPDYRADLAAGKRTLVVRLGRARASVAFAGIVALALVGLVLARATGAPAAALLGAAGFVPAGRAARTLARTPEHTATIVPAQALTLLGFLLLALGTGLGTLLSSHGANR